MNDDIVARARKYVRNLGGDPQDYLVWQLADEIEQLRAADKSRVTVHAAEIRRLAIECGKAKDEIEQLRMQLADHGETVTRLETENQKMREALKEAEKLIYDSGFMLGEAHTEIKRLRSQRVEWP